MGLLDKLKRKIETTLSESRLEEELLYKHVLEERMLNITEGGIPIGIILKNTLRNGEEKKTLINTGFIFRTMLFFGI
jgi:hypothetical protein